MTYKEIMDYLSSISPETLLLEKNKGFPIRDIDVDLVEELRKNGLCDEIIKVLLYYVLRRACGLRFDVVRDMAEKCVKRNIRSVQEAFFLTVEEDFRWKTRREKLSRCRR